MKHKYYTSILILMLTLSLGFFSTQTRVSADATQTFQTGDRLEYQGERYVSEVNEGNMFGDMMDPVNGSWVPVHDSWFSSDLEINANTSTNVFVIRNSHGFDSLFLINDQSVTNVGSYINKNITETDYLDPNQTFSDSFSDDLSGMTDFNFNMIPSSANATYAYMPEEFFWEDTTVEVGPLSPDFPIYIPPLNVSVEKDVTSVSANATINNNFFSFTGNAFEMFAATNYSGSDMFPIDTPDFSVMADIYYNISFYEYYYALFDASTGIPISIGRETGFAFEGYFETGPFTADIYNPANNSYMTVDLNITGVLLGVSIMGETQDLVFASSHYGNQRPISSGSPPLLEGDVLQYGWSSENSFGMNMAMNGQIFDSNGTGPVDFQAQVDHTDEQFGFGATDIEIYRNHPNSVEGLIWTIGNVTGTSTDNSAFYTAPNGWDNQTNTYSYDDTYFNVRPMFSSSNDSYELWNHMPYSLPNPLYMDGMDFIYGFVNMPIDLSFIPMDIPLVYSGYYSETGDYNINGYDFSFPVDVYEDIYNTSFSTTQSDNFTTVSISGYVSMYFYKVYDPVTGVLVEFGSVMDMSMTIDIMTNPMLQQDGPGDVGMVINNAHIDLYGYSAESNVIFGHPHKYNVPPITNTSMPTNTTVPTSSNTTTMPTSNSTTTVPTSNGTTTSSVSTTSTVQNNNTGSGNNTSVSPSFVNPGPGFELYLSVGVLAVMVLFRKRKK